MLKKRSFSLSGHRTSIALEPEFWEALQAMAETRRQTLAGLVESVDSRRGAGENLASALRIAALRAAATPCAETENAVHPAFRNNDKPAA